jgi:hypothetical protein
VNAGSDLSDFIDGFIVNAGSWESISLIYTATVTDDRFKINPLADSSTSSPSSALNAPSVGDVAYIHGFRVTNTSLLVPASDVTPTLDAYGNALTFRRTPKTLNLTDGASAQIAAPVPDTIKTVANWIWHDGTAKTHIDGGNWTVGSTTTALTSTGFTGAAYFVNGVSGTTLSAGWNHVLVASPAALTTPYIHYTEVQAHFLAYITTEGADTALQNYTTTKSDYGL